MDERKNDQSHILLGPIVNKQEEKKSKGKKEQKILLIVTITLIAYSRNWAIIVSIITTRFMVD
jgi:hypothetical protein